MADLIDRFGHLLQLASVDGVLETSPLTILRLRVENERAAPLRQAPGSNVLGIP
jgi:hypothetical protein